MENSPLLSPPVQKYNKFRPSWLQQPDATSRVNLDHWVSANSGVPLAAYKDPIDRLSAQYLADPKSTFVFDASDAMPAAVGAGKEWTEFTAWFGEGKSVADVVKAIDAAWPAK